MKKYGFILGLIVLLFTQAVFADELIRNNDFSSTNPSYIPEWVTGSAFGGDYVPKIHTNLYEPPWPNGNSGTVCVMPGNSLGATGLPPILISSLFQDIYVPKDTIGTNITLYYQWFVRSPNVGTKQNVRGKFGTEQIFYVESPGGGGPTPTPGWREVSCYLPLEIYDGTSPRLIFEVNEDGVNDPHYLHIDKISLDVITATKTNTPTITPTYTETPTLTITPTFTITPTITQTRTITPTITLTATVTPWAVPSGDVIVYPNPAAGDSVTFMYSLGEPADVNIDVYNLLGYKVAHLEDKNKPGLINRKTTWDIKDLAPGVYLYQVLIRTRSGQVQKNKIQRLVITK